MVMLIDAQTFPPLLFAQMMYCVRVELTRGEPEMNPLLNAIPFGRDGSISHVSGVPPESIGLQRRVASVLVNVSFSGL